MPDTPTGRLALYKSKSDGSELVTYTQDIGQNWDKVDLAVGFQAATSTTRPSGPYSGKPIFQTDTSYSTFFHNGTSPASGGWVEIPNSASTFSSNLKLAAGAQLVIGADVNLFRSASNVLRTNDALIVDGALTASSTASVAGALTVGGDLKLNNGSTTYRNKLSTGVTVASTTAETVLAALTIPAADAVAGAVYKVTAWGVVHSNTGAETLALNFRLGGVAGTSMTTLGATAVAATAFRPWRIEYYLTCVSTGASGTWNPFYQVLGSMFVNAVTGEVRSATPTAAVVRDTTTSADMVITGQWSASNANNVVQVFGCTGERLA